MRRRVQIAHHGGPEVLKLVESEELRPAGDELLIEQSAIGVNFRDIYERRGQYPLALPSGLGMEAAGTVLEVGARTSGFSAGDRVGYGLVPGGAYADARCVPASQVVHIPDAVDYEAAASLLLKGMTVEFLVERCFAVRPGQWVLFHSISGGVGSLACQWLKAVGARVIGTVGTTDKVDAAYELGCDHVVARDGASFVDAVLERTEGNGVSVAYDSIGLDTLDDSLRCVAPRGTLVSFGASSGPAKPIDLQSLFESRGVFLCRPGLESYIGTRSELLLSSSRVFQMISDKHLRVSIGNRFELEQVHEAHLAMESGTTRGATVLWT